MRAAPVFTSYNFTVHLQPGSAGLEAEVRLGVRNDGSTPLASLPLQLSSSLHFDQVRQNGKGLPFASHTIQSDADHTGALTEIAVALPTPLAPGAEASLVVDYAGSIVPSTVRLDRLGAPTAIAARSDWDRISESFTGLRGFGNVVWYPVASVPALLGDGNRLFHEIGRQKQRNSDARISLAITAEFTGDAPSVAVLNGHAMPPLVPAAMPTAAFPGVMRLALPPTTLGFDTPSIVMATRMESVATPFVSVAALPANAEARPNYTAAGSLLEPLFREWLGTRPDSALQLIDLPVESGSPAQDGGALLLSLAGGQPSQLAGDLSAPLAHAWFHSPRAWLSEGVPGLMRVLWIERTEGRDKALQQLGGQRDALALAEPASPGTSLGQPLIVPQDAGKDGAVRDASAQDAIFYRTKATYVLWMLRSIVGDAALGATLRAYNPDEDTTPNYFEKLLEQQVVATGGAAVPYSDKGDTASQPAPSGSTVGGQGAPGADASSQPDPRDLAWFFRNWVYADLGLPDLSISNVYSSRTGAGDQWLVAVDVANSGYAEAEVPVIVHSASTNVTLQVRVPARGTLSRRILLLGEPTEVDVNDGTVPEVQAGAHQRLIQ